MSKKEKNKKKKKTPDDLTSFVSPESLKFDPNGSWTGTTAATYYGEEDESPVQDADDL
ncbi:MAG: hypothetical protein PUG26_03745 [Oscillospiraceae bacterium]|nr:hypothetical protein [Oscillospiraceae bacterium]